MAHSPDSIPAAPADARTVANKWADRAAAVFGLAGAILLLLMMSVTFVDVVGRYLFNQPLDGAFELTEVMLAVLVFAGLPLVCRSEDNVTVTLLTDRLPISAQSLHAAVMSLLGTVVLLVVAWRLWHRAERLVSYGDVTTFYRLPLGPVAYVMAVLAGIAAVFLLINMVLHLIDLRARRGPNPHDLSRDV